MTARTALTTAARSERIRVQAEEHAGHPLGRVAEPGADYAAERPLLRDPDLAAHARLDQEPIDHAVVRDAQTAPAGRELTADRADLRRALDADDRVRAADV